MNTKERIIELEGCVKELSSDLDYLRDEKIELEDELRDVVGDMKDLKIIVSDLVFRINELKERAERVE